MVNQTGYGLTSGMHSLDEREHAHWTAGVHAGNLYFNRGTTGAIVLRQPFGGMGRSVFGPGLKAGGPNYVAQFLTFADLPMPACVEDPLRHPALQALAAQVTRLGDAVPMDEAAHLQSALRSYAFWWQEEFSRPHDQLRLLGQDNLRRYLPFAEIRVQLSAHDTAFEIFARVAAAGVTGARVVVSRPPGIASRRIHELSQCTKSWADGIAFLEETNEQVADVIRKLPAHAVVRLRYAAPDRVPPAIRAAAAEAAVHLADEPVIAHGRVELLWYLREQSISWDYHRYGNLGARAGEARQEPL
jgi:RHH-type proline utilization regulon transcriptional repressor/proline dehydrogenase/delta 1-pyrroline-5-carboxylate dehydrogenase